MSGTRRLLSSVIAGKKGSESALTSVLMNENEEAKKQDVKNGKKQKKSK